MPHLRDCRCCCKPDTRRKITPRPFAENPRQRRGGICIIVNHFEEDGGAGHGPIDIDLEDDEDDDDDFVFEDEFSSNIGSSMTVLDSCVDSPACEMNGANKSTRGTVVRHRTGAGRLPLIRKLFTLALYRRAQHNHQQQQQEEQHNPQSVEMTRRGRGVGGRNENKLKTSSTNRKRRKSSRKSGVKNDKKGWWTSQSFLFCSLVEHLPFIRSVSSAARAVRNSNSARSSVESFACPLDR